MTVARTKRPRLIGPYSEGLLFTPSEFDRAHFEEGWRYELIQGVLLVTPIPRASERDPNDELGHMLRLYRENHPQGHALQRTLFEQTISTGENRRRADRVIWAGPRKPKIKDTPTIVVEFVSKRKRDRERDYRTKRIEYLRAGVKEYWVIDRFLRSMTVFWGPVARIRRQVISEQETYRTSLLPGFELPLAKLLGAADYWAGSADEGEE